MVEEFISLTSTGRFDEAFEFCTEEAQVIVQAMVDSGCKPYETKIDSVKCEVNGDEALCTCYENQSNIGSINFKYELVVQDGQWKIKLNSGHLF